MLLLVFYIYNLRKNSLTNSEVLSMKKYTILLLIGALLNFHICIHAEDIYLSRGAIITIKATDIDPNVQEFTSGPKVYGLIDQRNKAPLKVITKVKKNTRKQNVVAEWKTKLRIYNKRDYQNIQKGPKLINAPIVDKPIDSIEVETRGDAGTITKSLPDNFFIAAPVVTKISGSHINPQDEFVVIGKYFGQKLPTILIEYQSKGRWKYKRCKVNKAISNLYQDARGRENKSCMKILAADPADDELVNFSKVTVKYPKLKPTDARSGYLIIDNKIGLNAYKMLSLTSPSFQAGALMNVKYCNLIIPGGQNISPALVWADPPAATKSFVVTCIDLYKKADNWVHWMVVDIPIGTLDLPEGASSNNMPVGAVELFNDFSRQEYGGPQPPTTALHRYAFTVYALNVESLNLNPNRALTEEELLEVIKDKILEKATSIGAYKRTE